MVIIRWQAHLFSCLWLVTGHCAPLFEDDFSHGLDAWEIHGDEAGVAIIDSGEAAHGPVLELTPAGLVYALIRGSHAWGPVRIEGQVKFPTEGNSYLGLVYNFTPGDDRVDFGSIYLKGNDGYLRVNPWRDGNASRLLYEELRTDVPDVEPGRWIPFAAEIVGSTCHFYVGDLRRPRIVFPHLELHEGAVGFKPRIAGAPVWIDNIRVRGINEFGYSGGPRPNVDYRPDELITDWQVLGPLAEPLISPHQASGWKPFETDPRGAVITGRVTHYNGPLTVAYFRTTLTLDHPRTATLHVTTVDELSLFVNGRFYSFIYRDGYIDRRDWNAWYDFWETEDHRGRRVPLQLEAGRHDIILGVRNGQFASGGFFARWELD